MKKIILVDDHIMFREGLANVLKGQSDFEVIGQAGTARDAVRLAHDLHPDIVLMDFGLPDESGIEATHTILEEMPGMIVVFLTGFDTDEFLFAAIRSGARGYLLKSLSSRELLASLRAIEKNEAAISRVMTKRILDEFAHLGPRREPHQSKLTNLTLRELEVLKELSVGATNRQIAEHIEISETTVKNHVHSILSKLGLKNRREVLWFAQRQGITDPIKMKNVPSSERRKDRREK